MKYEEHFEWIVKDTARGKKYRTRYTMSEADARARYPLFAEKVLGSGVMRHITETEAELATRLNHGKFQQGWTPPST